MKFKLLIVSIALMMGAQIAANAQLPDADKVEAIVRKCVETRRQILDRKLTTLETNKLTDKAVKEMRASLDKLRYKLHCEIVDVLETARAGRDFSNVKTLCKILEFPDSEPKTISIPLPSDQVKRLKPGVVVEFFGTLETTNAQWINCYYFLPLSEKNSYFFDDEANYSFLRSLSGLGPDQQISGLPKDDEEKIPIALGMKSEKCVILSPTLVKKIVDNVSKPDPRWHIPDHPVPTGSISP